MTRAKRYVLQGQIKDFDKGKAPNSEAQFCHDNQAKMLEPNELFVPGDLGPTYGPETFRVSSV